MAFNVPAVVGLSFRSFGRRLTLDSVSMVLSKDGKLHVNVNLDETESTTAGHTVTPAPIRASSLLTMDERVILTAVHRHPRRLFRILLELRKLSAAY